MPSIELKTLERLDANDVLLINAEQLIKAGKPVVEGMIKRLAKHKVPHVPVISFTYEEEEHLSLNNSKEQMLQLLFEEVEKRFDKIAILRERLLDKAKTLYVPYNELNPCFAAKGKKKQLTNNMLLESDPGPLYQPDIDAGSDAIIQNMNLKYILEILKTLHTHIEGQGLLSPDTPKQTNTISRLRLESIRMQSLYENTRLSNVGNAFPGHAVDCAIYFLVAMTNLNKIRITKGCSLSVERFDPDKSVAKGEKFQYMPGMIIDAALGIVLHAIGYSQNTIHAIVSQKPILKDAEPENVNKRRALQRNNFVIHNLIRNRKDVSSIAKMIVTIQYEYPDGTGFPPLNENKNLHEFIRLFQVIDFYDEMTNPAVSNLLYSRWDVIHYLLENCGDYNHVRGQFIKNKRFDKEIVTAFLQILAPYSIGEKVYLFPKGDRNTYYFVGRVVSYLDSWIPLISILFDKRTNKNYKDGTYLFYIPHALALHAQNKKVEKREKIEWIGNLEIYDYHLNPAQIKDYVDDLFGKERRLSNHLSKSGIRTHNS